MCQWEFHNDFAVQLYGNRVLSRQSKGLLSLPAVNRYLILLRLNYSAKNSVHAAAVPNWRIYGHIIGVEEDS